jgi:hypothetical protein
MPADRAKALEDAFMAMCKDKEVLADAAKFGIDMSPIDSAGVVRLLERMAATPKAVVAHYNAIAGQKGDSKKK